jgi:hypothetical protein
MTVFDLETTPESDNKLYDAKTIEEVFDAILDMQKRVPSQNYVNIALNYELSNLRIVMMNRHGLKFKIIADSYGNGKHYQVQFSGYPLWVYFINNVPVHFTDMNSWVDNPPHSVSAFNPNIEFDTFRKISF